MQYKRNEDDSDKRGFTIVELLIVIVVIAILAAITMVAYNGIANRAKVSAAQSAAQQIVKKIATYAVTHGDQYPADLAAIGITDDGTTTFQYSVNNSATPRTYCVTVTVSDISYFISNTQTNPQSGGCAGHGQGGVASVTNLATNPSFETVGANVEVWRNLAANPNAAVNSGFSSNNTTSWTASRNVTAPAGNPQGISTAAQSVLAPSATSASVLSMYNIDGLSNTGPSTRIIGAWMRVNASGYQARIGSSSGSYVSIAANVWTWVTGPASSTNWGIAEITKISGNAAASDVGYITGVTAIVGLAPTATIAGGIDPLDSDLTASWTGAANASESILTGANVWRATMGSGRAIRSSQWSSTGSSSARLIPTTDATSTTMLVADMAGNYGTTLQAGKTYTVVATRHLENPLTGPLDSTYAGRAILIETPAKTTFSDALPNVAGDGTIRWTFTVDAATTAATLRLGHGGSQGSGDVFWDDLMIVDGSYTGDFHDGASPNWIWNGAMHASSSTGPNL